MELRAEGPSGKMEDNLIYSAATPIHFHLTADKVPSSGEFGDGDGGGGEGREASLNGSRVVIRPCTTTSSVGGHHRHRHHSKSGFMVTRTLLLVLGIVVVVTLLAILVSLSFHWYYSVLENGAQRLKYNHQKMSGLQPKLLGKVRDLWQLTNRSVHEPAAREQLRNLSRNDRSTCYSALCLHTALNLLESMEWRTDPCQDFYAFACGGWVKRNPPDSATSVTDHFAKINDRVILATQKIIQAGNDQSTKKGLQMARSFYQECSNVDRLEAAGLGPIMGILEEYGGWPLLYGHALNDNWPARWNFAWIKMAALLQRLSISTILALEIKQDTAKPDENALFVVEPLFFLSREYLVAPQKNTRLLTAYKKFVVDVAHELIAWRKDHNSNGPLKGLEVDDVRLDDMAETMIAFEVNLAKLVTPETIITSVVTYYDVANLQNETDGNWTNSQPLNRLIWQDFFNHTFAGSNINFQGKEKILVHDLPYIQGLVRLLDRTPTETLANYLLWRLMAKFTTGSTKRLRRIHSHFYQDLYGEQKLLDRNSTCAMVINSKFTIAVGSEFVKDSFESSLKREVEVLAASVKIRMEELLGKQSFIPHLLQMAIRQKLAMIKLCVGYPRSFTNESYVESFYEGLDLEENDGLGNDSYIGRYIKVTTWLFLKGVEVLRQPFDRECWGGNYWSFIGEAYAYYDTARNSINLPVGLLQSPFYYQRPSVPWYMNYGGIGTIIGHELTHSLNIEGWIRIKLVPQLETLWECLISSYSEADIPELDGKSKMDGYRTRSENFADHFGLASAFWAYQQYARTIRNPSDLAASEDGGGSTGNGGSVREGQEISLPGLELFTSSQMFFISFANMWCDAKSKESLYDEVESSTHTPSKYRVLGALKNSKDFAQAWNCVPSSNMNPRHKCNLF